MSTIRTMTLPLCLVASMESGFAETPVPTPTSPEKTLDTVTVEASSEEPMTEKIPTYTVKKSSSATKLDISTLETPQTVNVVTRQLMEDFGLTNARDVLAATPGVIVQNQETDRTSFSSRGSEISIFQTDGLGVPFEGYNYQTGDIDTYIFDRVEVVKGANGLTSSLGDPGATVNFIRKRPTFGLQASGGLNYGSWDTRRVEGDISSPLNSSASIRGRLIVAGQEGNSYLDHYSSKKNIVSGILEADLTDFTLLTLGHFVQQNKPKGNNWGALPLLDMAGQQLEYARSYNPVSDWVNWEKNTNNSFIELKQKISADWEVKATYSQVEMDEDASLLYYFGAPDADGVGVSAYPGVYITKQSQTMADVSLKGGYALLGKRHELIVGSSWATNKNKAKSYDAESVPDVNWNDWSGQFEKPNFILNDTDGGKADSKETIKALYAATRFTFTDELKLLVGANQTQAESSGNSYGTRADYDKSKTMPYAGITYNITPNYTSYASYSTIFRPQSQLDTEGKVIDPVDGAAQELGVKGSWLNNRIGGSVALFQTLQKNFPLRASDSASIIKNYIVGDLKTSGFEMNVSGKVTDDVNLVFGYTQVQLKDGKTGGKTRTYLPAQFFNLLATYQVPAVTNLKIGAGLTWQDKTHQDIEGNVYVGEDAIPYAGTIRQDSYALVNAMASFAVNQNLSLQANGENLTNKKYLNSFPDGQGFYGAPANYSFGVNFRN